MYGKSKAVRGIGGRIGLITLLACCVWMASAAGAAVTDWNTNPATGNLYKVVGPGTWQACEDLAKAEGAHLVIINTWEEQLWLQDTFCGNGEQYWIGLYQPAGSPEPGGGWTWVNGEPTNYTNWKSGEPNNYGGSENCAVMNYGGSGGYWNDLPESDSSRAIIEKPVWQVNPGNGHLYRVAGPGTWQENETFAQAEGAHLVTIRNAKEQYWLLATFGRDKRYQIGFYQPAGSPEPGGGWTWISGEGPATYTNWASGQPDNAGNAEHWATMNWASEGGWNDCPADWKELAIIEKSGDWRVNPATGNLYTVVGPGTWQQCENLALSLGGHLVTVNDAAEQQWLTTTFGTSEQYWIGLTDAAQEGAWVWVSGESSTYTFWAASQPDNAGGVEHYAVMNYDGAGGHWNDWPGSKSYRAIVEKPGGWLLNPANNHFYKLVGPGNGEECEALAQAEGVHLAAIRSQAEQDWLVTTFLSNDQFYIGFYQPEGSPEPDGGWCWRSGEPVTYTNWDWGQPDNYGGVEHWAVMNFGSPGKWNDWHNNQRFKGIIEKTRGVVVTTKAIPATGLGLTNAGDEDKNWTVNGKPAQLLAPGAANWYGGWLANGPNSNWIGITAGNANNGPAPYTFQVQFDLSSFVLSSVSLSGKWAIDDEGTLSVNGHQIASLGNSQWGGLNSFTLAAGSGYLNQGVNTLEIKMTSSDNYLEGVRLEGVISGLSSSSSNKASTGILMLLLAN